jgi:hypothetical protein
MKLMAKPPSGQILVVTKKVISVCLIFTLLSVGLSYAAYADDFSVSALPWKISALFAFLFCFGPVVICLRDRGANALWAYGAIMLIFLSAIYYFFGIFGYFYFFIFAPVSVYLKWPGLVGGVLLTSYWVVVTYRNVMKTIKITSFVENAFEDCGDYIGYQIQKGTREFDKRYKELDPVPKIFIYLIYGVAPFYLILNRMLSSTFGSTGILLFIAVLGMPMSLWFVGVFVRGYLVMVALPLRMEKERHKRVIVIG